MERRLLTDDELKQALEDLASWTVKNGKLHKTFKFDSFGQAIGWMVSVSFYADKLDHHPDWCNSYNRVVIDLLTHDLGALSTLDVALAKKMDTLVE